jgi:hypothetical protein
LALFLDFRATRATAGFPLDELKGRRLDDFPTVRFRAERLAAAEVLLDILPFTFLAPAEARLLAIPESFRTLTVLR